MNLLRIEDIENLYKNNPHHPKTGALLVCMRVVFHERRLQFSNQMHWQAWSQRQRQVSSDKSVVEINRFGDNNRFSENFSSDTQSFNGAGSVSNFSSKKLKNTGRFETEVNNRIDRVLKIDIPVSRVANSG